MKNTCRIQNIRPTDPVVRRRPPFLLPLGAAGFAWLVMTASPLLSDTPTLFPTRDFPPPAGLLACTDASPLSYGDGAVRIRDLRMHSFDRSATAPALGATVWHTCASRLEMEVSLDGGLTWQSTSGRADSVMRLTHASDLGGVETHKLGEPLDCTVPLGGGGGGGGGALMFRTQPGSAGSGTMHIQAVPGGYLIDSFFDIFTEVSTDGGTSWQPSTSSARLELRADHRPGVALAAPSRLLPAPPEQYQMPAGTMVMMANGMVIRHVRHKLFGLSVLPPAPGAPAQSQTFGSQVEMEVSTTGPGGPFASYYAPATTQTSIRRLTDGGRELYENEMTALTVGGGNLPANVLIRESPTLPSRGLTSMVPGTPGYEVSSFFDIFLEVSTDGGASWSPVMTGPALVQSAQVGPSAPYGAELLPPPDSQYRSLEEETAVYPTGATFPLGIVVRHVVLRNFTQSVSPPVSGSQTHSFNATVDLELSTNGGNTFQPVTTSAICAERITCAQDQGSARYFSTEMLQLNILSGLPSGLRIRESPTKASSGRTSDCPLAPVGPYMIDSFFDIFTEISTDGGSTWTATTAGPLTVALQPTLPAPLWVTAPVNRAVSATGPSGAEVEFTATTGGGVPPRSLVCSPPSGSLFPPGDTTVNCTVTDSVGQQASASFLVTVAPWSVPPRFFAQKLLPPPNGLHVTPGSGMLLLPNGVALRNLHHHGFTSSVAPPALGGSLTHACGSWLELEVSTDGGTSWSPVDVPAATGLRMTHVRDNADEEEYSVEITGMDASGGTLPAGLMIRESPTKASAGTTRIKPAGGGYMIDSFFDIYIEVSTDGGGTWTPGPDPAEARLVPDPFPLDPDETLSLLMPPPDDRLVSTQDPAIASAAGIRVRNLDVHSLTAWTFPPPPDGSATVSTTGYGDCDWSIDGGLSWQRGGAPVNATLTMTRWGRGHVESYDTEMVQFEMSGGTLPGGVMIRESPTKASRGFTRCAGGGAGSGADVVQSFFDIFTEVSTDGGATWQPASGAPTHLEVRALATPHVFTQEGLAPTGGRYASPSGTMASFASGIVIRNLRQRSFDSALPLPPTGGTITNATTGWTDMEISYDDGGTFAPAYAIVQASLRATERLATGSTRYFDTEMLQMDIGGGNLPSGLVIRESPTLASLSRAVAKDEGGGVYLTDSFFDVYTELSTDFGFSWQPASHGSIRLLLEAAPPPPLLEIHGPQDITVRATSPAGAVVVYPTPATSGGCPPIDVVCVPPSGSTFPVGVTTVSCTAMDMCDQIARCSFQVAVLRPLQKHFFADQLLLPPNGILEDAKKAGLKYLNGILVRNLVCHQFDASVLPPPEGESLGHTFGSVVEMDVSFDGGLTWETCTATGTLSLDLANLGPDGGDTLYAAEMLQFSVSGGTLPAGVMIRESPTKASLGETRTESVPGGYQIDSFFDIFTEVSTDGGTTWTPSVGAVELELKADAGAVRPVALPRNVFPAPNGLFASGDTGPSFASGILIRDIDLTLPTQWMAPPTSGGSLTFTYDLQLDFRLSTDGGLTWTVARAPGTMTVPMTHVRAFGAENDCDLMVTQLDVQGGDLPVGVMIRESPTRASQGGLAVTDGGGGGSGRMTVSSFFDIFTEISTDGGGSWAPSTTGPAHFELERLAPAHIHDNNLMPQPDGRYACDPSARASFASGHVIRNLVCRSFSSSVPPPLPGWSTSHTFGSQVEMEVSSDGGLTFESRLAPATMSLQMTGRLEGDGVTEHIDTETTQFNVSGGNLPTNFMVRESPTRASLGRTTQTSLSSGDNDCDSFFDIFIEVSTDGGLSWMPATSGLLRMILEPASAPPLLTLTPPADEWVLATSPAGATVAYPPPEVTGGLPPLTVVCNPPSGSAFPIGITIVTCQATDSAGQFASGTFRITVLPYRDPPEHYYVSEYLPPERGMHVSPQPWFALYPVGIVLRDVRSFALEASFPPPGPGASRTDTWHSVVELEISFDGGATFVPMTGPAATTARTTCTAAGGGSSSFDTEMLGFDLILPGGILLRESPTLPSLGRARSRLVTGGAMISSFFDVYTELSTDGGATWCPAQDAAILESRVDDSVIPDLPAPTSLLPPPGDRMVQGSGLFLDSPAGIQLTGVRLSIPSGSVAPPLPGVLQQHSFGAQVDFHLSTDGGVRFAPGRATASVTLATTQLGSSASPRYDTEMLSLSISGGDLPAGILVRESPTNPSRGDTVVRALGDGTYRLSSFFDVLIEVSTDGGQTWSPSTTAPARLELADADTAEEYASPNLPPPVGLYAVLPAAEPVSFANGVVVRGLVKRFFTQSIPPPPPGGTQMHSYGASVDMLVSFDNGLTFSPCTAPANVTQRVGSMVDQGSTRYFDTEMLQLNISGGGLPPNCMIRESPTKASLGRTSERSGGLIGTWSIDSFFDLFTEVSTDGGMTWWPSTSGPLTLALRPPTASEAWRLLHFGTTLDAGEADDLADPDHDGLPNIVEMATHTDPRQPNGSPATGDTSSGHLVLTWTRDKATMAEVSVWVEYSTDLSPGSWIDCPTGPPLWDDGIVQGMMTTIPEVGGGKCFARLRVTR